MAILRHVSQGDPVVIYGVALLALCMLGGLVLGQAIGLLIGVQANVGGVGIGMLALIAATELLRGKGRLKEISQQGIVFWSSIYIPIVVAMAASQDVLSAIRGGPIALFVGGLVTLACFAMVPVLDRLSQREPEHTIEESENRVDD